jgi:hypothetical protein
MVFGYTFWIRLLACHVLEVTVVRIPDSDQRSVCQCKWESRVSAGDSVCPYNLRVLYAKAVLVARGPGFLAAQGTAAGGGRPGGQPAALRIMTWASTKELNIPAIMI